ncbi:DNA polymerase I [Streptomyces laurentii]|uniref:DNA polymerase I n=1 Tax=Streptomyces laurentii TaxID=39478 RepID=A0A160P9D2_STRLU|nr:DNA polymerase I [Streptomyces laurentii]
MAAAGARLRVRDDLLAAVAGLAAADTAVSSGSTTTVGPNGVSTSSGTSVNTSNGPGFTISETTHEVVAGVAGFSMTDTNVTISFN